METGLLKSPIVGRGRISVVVDTGFQVPQLICNSLLQMPISNEEELSVTVVLLGQNAQGITAPRPLIVA